MTEERAEKRAAIRVENLIKTFKDVRAVDGISFETKEGELFAFLGENGAGKSTSISVICGLLKKDGGKVTVDGRDIDEDDTIKSEIGVVFQSSVLDKPLSARENLTYRAALYGIVGEACKNRIKELNELLDFGEFIDRPLAKLSGGQKRKIDIARALLNRPKILILDEPTTGLDPQTRIMVWNCLNDLRKETGLTIFLTTHYMEEAAESDYVVILDCGKVVACDTPVGLKNAYASDFIKVYEKNETLFSMIEKEGLLSEEREGHVLIEIPNVAEVRRLIFAYPEAFSDFEVEKGKMDDVFLKATGKQLSGGAENA